MTKEELKRAKEKFNNACHDLEYLKKDSEWIKYNVSYETVIEWLIEYIDDIFNQIDKYLNSNLDNNRKEIDYHVILCVCILCQTISDYKLETYYDKLVLLLKEINYDEYLMFSQDYSFDGRGHYIVQYILRDKENKNFRYEYNGLENILYHKYQFDTNERFFGLLAVLYKNNKLNLFNELLNICCDFISNCGAHALTRDLYNYANYIKDENVINKVIKSIKEYKNNFYLYRGIYEPKELIDIHIDKEKELIWLRRNFYILLEDDKNKAYSNEVINYYLDYYKIEKKILNEWESNIIEYYENILNNAEAYLKLDTSFIDMNKHSKYYVEYLKEIKNGKYIVNGILNYVITNSKYEIINKDVVHHALKILLDTGLYVPVLKKDFYSKILSDDLNEGYLIKYYNKDKNDYDLYKRILLKLFKYCVNLSYLGENDTKSFVIRVNQFANKYNDKELLESTNEFIYKKITSLKESARNYIIKTIKEIKDLINIGNIEDKEKRIKNCRKVHFDISQIMCYVAEYELDEFLEDIINILIKLNVNEYIAYSIFETKNDNFFAEKLLMYKDDIVYVVFDEEDKKEVAKILYFVIDDDKFIGLLPYLYKKQKLDLFYKLIDILCDLISNLGIECQRTISYLYNYANYIKDENVINKVIKSIKEYKNNFYSYRDIYEPKEIIDIHIDKEKELIWLRRNFYILLEDDNNKAYSNEVINYYLDYYKIDKKILNEWESNIIEYYENILNNAEAYLKLDTSFIDMNKHSKYYVEYLKEKLSFRQDYLEKIQEKLGLHK